MPLTKDQIQKIDIYIKSCGVQWYDVRMELVDHFAMSVSTELNKSPNLDFKQALNKVHKNFGNNGFKDLLASKTKAVEKQFYKSAIKYFVGFFKLPRIILTGLIYYGLTKFQLLFEDKSTIYLFLFCLVIYTMVNMILRSIKLKNGIGEKFLTLNQGLNYLQIIQGFYIMLNSISTSFRSEESYNNMFHNNLLIGVYVLLTLFLISCEYVYYHLKQDIKNQFPNIKLAQ